MVALVLSHGIGTAPTGKRKYINQLLCISADELIKKTAVFRQLMLDIWWPG